jgi:hypothetical protein
MVREEKRRGEEMQHGGKAAEKQLRDCASCRKVKAKRRVA